MESGNVGECLLLYESTVQRTSARCTLMTLQIILKYFGYLENNGHNGQMVRRLWRGWAEDGKLLSYLEWPYSAGRSVTVM